MNQIVNEIYAPLFQNQSRYIILMGGRGAGRSTVASQFVLAKLTAPEYFRCALMRSISSDIRHSSWHELSDRIDEQNIRNGLKIGENDMNIEYGVNSIQAHGFRASSGSHSAKLKSLASYNVVWIEEAEEIGEQEFRTLDDTLRTVRGDIKIIFTLNPPPKSHWIIQRWFDLIPARIDGFNVDGFYQPRLKQDIKDATHVFSTFRDNLANLDAHTVERYEHYRDINPSYYWQMIEGLVPEVVRGKIYSGWRLIDHIPFNARLVRYGLDFGWFPDPVCLVAVYYYDGGYIVDELAYGNEIPNKVIAETIQSHGGKALTVADSAEEKSIEEIGSYGVSIMGAEKGVGSVNYGIKVVAGEKISVTRRSKNLWRAYENYAWAEDKDGNPKGMPNHNFSDPLDALRYALVSLNRTDIAHNKREEQDMIFARNQYNQGQNESL